MSAPLRFRPHQACLSSDIPVMSQSGFCDWILGGTGKGGRLLALFGVDHGVLPDPSIGGKALLAVLAFDEEGTLEAAACNAGARFPSMASACPEAALFEREILEEFGIIPVGHPWPKPVRFPRGNPGIMDFYRMEGDEVHEVAVGPVHAGVIEPGHFRFQCHGENVYHLEISLGYQHRGIERAVIANPDNRRFHYFETLCGDTTAGHAITHARVLEALSGAGAVPPRALALRSVALELERLANHTGDLGALAGDVGFLPTQSFCGRIRGDFLNLTALLCGSRFGRGLVRPGGVRFDLGGDRLDDLRRRLDAAFRDVEGALSLLWKSDTVADRFEGTGRLSPEDAKSLGLVGPAARAAGLRRDTRIDFPDDFYPFAAVPLSTWDSGDVFARAQVRHLEIRRSIAFLRDLLSSLPQGAVSAPLAPPAAGRLAVALTEGWRGEIVHVALTGRDGKPARYKVVDPSFRNWSGLALALRGCQISDFPLCNKSFNLSYCGFDL